MITFHLWSTRDVGPNSALTEAVCEWFDDLYAPADNPALYNPGAFERGLREWQACFSEPELAAMAEYHKYFESIERDFEVDRSWDEIEADSRWRGLIEAARKALDVFTQTI